MGELQQPGQSKPESAGAAEKLVFALLLLVLLLMPSQLAFRVKGVNVTPADLLLLIAAVIWLVAVRDRKSSLPPACCWVLIAVAGVSVLGRGPLSPRIDQPYDWRNALAEAVQLVEYFIVAYFLFAWVLQSPRRRQWAVFAVFVGTSLVIIHALVQRLSGWEGPAIRATFGSRNAYGGYLALILPLMYGVALTSRSRGIIIWLAIAIGLGLVTIMSGPALIALLVAFALISWFASRRAFAICLAAIIVGLLVMPYLLPRNYQDTLVELATPSYQGEVKKQYLEWQAALNLLEDNCLLGVGIGNYQTNIGRYYYFMPNVEILEPDSNSGYLVVASTLGLLGLIALIAILFHFGRRAWKLQMRDRPRTGLVWGLRGSLVSFAVVSFFTLLLVRGTGLAVAFILALILALEVPHESTE